MTLALVRRREPWAVEDPFLDFLIFMHDMYWDRLLVEAVYYGDNDSVIDEDEPLTGGAQ